MRVIRKTCLLVLLLVAALFVQSASATDISISSLPESSYLDGKWHGSSFYDKDGFDALITFDVYDTEGGNEIAEIDGFETPGDGQYIYVYQIFQSNKPDYSKDITYFSILDIGGVAIDGALMEGTTALDDGDGIEPTTPSETQGVWKWTFEGGGYISNAEHSWFLVFSSDSAPVAGSFKMKDTKPNDHGPAPGIPEPGTLALLSIGGAMLFSKRRKSVLAIKFYNRTSKG